MLIRVHLDHITLLDRSVAAVEDEIEAALDAIPAAWGTDADGEPGPGPRPGRCRPAGGRTARGDPRLSLDLARAIIAETGLDMSIFPTAAHLASCAGLASQARNWGPPSNRAAGRAERGFRKVVPLQPHVRLGLVGGAHDRGGRLPRRQAHTPNSDRLPAGTRSAYSA